MSTVKATRGMRTLVGMGLAALLAATPVTVEVGGRFGFIVTKTIAVAEDGGSSGSGGNSGPGGGDHGSNGNGGHKGGDGKDAAGDDADSQKDRRRGNQKLRRLGPHGEKIEIDGNRIEITYPDGFREEIANGALELRDPAGRIVIRRAATDRDLKRLQAF